MRLKLTPERRRKWQDDCEPHIAFMTGGSINDNDQA